MRNIYGSARSFLAYSLFHYYSVIFLPKDITSFEERSEEVLTLVGSDKAIAVTEETVTQIEFFNRIIQQEKLIAVIKRELINLPAPRLKHLTNLSLRLKLGDVFNRDQLTNWLFSQDYELVDLVTEPGEFAVRGSIVDVFLEKLENPVRIEFFGDEIVSIRYFDALTQCSIKPIASVEITGRKIPFSTEEPFLSIFPNHFVILLENQLDPKLTELLPRNNIVVIFAEADGDFDFGFLTPNIYLGNLSVLGAEIESSNLTYYIVVRDWHQQERLQKILGEKPHYLVTKLNGGFIAPNDGYAVLTEKEIYGAPIMRLPKRRFKGLPVDNLLTLKKGDYVVHHNYGVGIFEGTKRLKIDNQEKDFLYIRYAGAGRLYLPIENLNFLDRYIGSEERPPVLDRLGSRNWAWAKAKAQKAATDFASELIQLYAQRSITQGFRFLADTEWQAELEAAFPFQETPDQSKAWEEVKKDMESDKVMDRLICGDVGFGKTEIALRAAFKAVMAGKQVVMLVPTTILAYQHYNTFSQRLAKFPIRVEMLSRLVSPAQRKAIIEGLKNGKVDIVIGTHILLQAAKFAKDLGLLIIDEEQRFGVRQKEAIKKLKLGIDALTLTATPIPRTLYMSLVGLRDISVINTPPLGRKEIKTEVLPWDGEVIHTRIRQEIARGGQVFIVHNRIESLPKLVKKIQKLCPDLRIVSAHGRMPEHLLAKIYLDFVKGNYDILITTAIIESGIDMPKVNTIIVDHADWFGLADLHQLRGRVGRSKEQGYALFIVPETDKISPASHKRLSAILQYSKLGQGFKLALRDMEIRGIGDLLGEKQHGHITRVGFSLYVSLLKEAIAKLKGEEPIIEPDLSFDVEAYIPEEFISDSYERVAIYRRFLAAETKEEIEAIKEELIDRFAKYPPIMENLIKIALIRVLARKAGIYKIILKQNRITIIGVKTTKELIGGLDKIIEVLLRADTKWRN
uniref:Transcription-repair-coupling factor n=1 Tax=candidate division WOR-3 bacterium TaxID=2052148 RepID=A0A7C6A9Y4_UNCW3